MPSTFLDLIAVEAGAFLAGALAGWLISRAIRHAARQHPSA